MFALDELESLSKVAYASPRYELEDLFYKEEIDAIQDGGTRADNLLQRIFIPKHNGPFKTVRLQQLYADLNVEKWLLAIADCLRYGNLITIDIGFSYIVWKPNIKTGQHEMRYVYAAKALSFDRVKVHTRSQLHDFAAKFSKLNNSDYLMDTFMTQLKGNVFETSGFIPRTLVCAYCWIHK